MMLSRKDIERIIREYVAIVRAAGIPVTEVRLFGSRARGTPRHEFSDIDLCVISPQFAKNRSAGWDTLLVATTKLDSPVPIEPIPFTPGDLADRYSTLATEIREQGERVEV